MAGVTRQGLYGGPRSPYGSFAGKTEQTVSPGDISKIEGVAMASIARVNGVLVANISKVNGRPVP